MSQVEVLVPFQLDVHGRVAQTAQPNIQQMQHVQALVSTYPGERVMRPNYGIPLRDYVFAPGPDFVTQEITQDVVQQMATWEPTIQVNGIVPDVDDETRGVVSLDVQFSSGPNTSSTTNTATVFIGGSVSETTSIK